MLKILGASAFLGLLFFGTAVEAHELNIENEQVDIVPIVEDLNGRQVIDMDEERYFVEFVLDGHVLRSYENESFLWLDGIPRAYYTSETDDDFVVPRSDTNRGNVALSSYTYFASFLNRVFDYEIDGDMLVYANPEDLIEEEEPEPLPELPPLLEEEDEEEDTEIVENDTGEEDESDSSSNEEDESEETEDISSNESEEEIEDEEPEEVEPELIGNTEFSLDVADYPLYTIDNPMSSGLRGSDVVVYFSDESEIVVLYNGEENVMNVSQREQETFRFYLNEEEYVEVHISVEDLRHEGLTRSRLESHMLGIDSGIFIGEEDGRMLVSYSNEAPYQRDVVLNEVEERLMFFEVLRFEFDDSFERHWELRFRLEDSEW